MFEKDKDIFTIKEKQAIPNVDLDKDVIEIDYKGYEGETHRKIKPIGKESANYGDYYLQCFCFLRNEERTFRLSSIEKLTINEKEHDPDMLIHIVPDYKWKYNFNTYITYQNVEGGINNFDTIINNIRIAENGDYYIDRLSLYKDLFTLNTKRIKKIKINGENIENPAQYFENIFLSNFDIGKYVDHVKLLTYIARIDNRFTKNEADIIREYISLHDKTEDAYSLIQLKCTEDDYKNILENSPEWPIAEKKLILEIINKIYDTKKKKNPAEEDVVENIRKLLSLS